MQNVVQIKKADDELQIVWGEVYVPDIPDSQGEYMTKAEVRKMAYRFLGSGRVKKIDRGHDNKITGAFVVESFIARENDPDFISDSWVVGVHIPSKKIWADVKNGELNAFSMEAFVHTATKEIEIEVPEELRGTTFEEEGHRHPYRLVFNDEGQLVGGMALKGDTDHQHKIIGPATTEETHNHKHRFDFIEALIKANGEAED